MEDVSEVCFMSYAEGSLLLNKLLSIPAPWQKKIKIGRIVQIAPRTKSSRLIMRLNQFAITKWICGPMIEELTDEGISKFPSIPNKFECGTILISDEVNQETDNPNCVIIKKTQTSPLKNRKVINAAINFIYKGQF